MAENKTYVRPPISTFRQILLSFFWFSTNMMWSAIRHHHAKPGQGGGWQFGQRHGTRFGSLRRRDHLDADCAHLWRTFRPHSSPRRKTQTLGRDRNRRKCNWFGWNGLSHSNRTPESLWPWSIAFWVVQFFNNVATAPYSALIPDLVSSEQRGSASGWLGLMTILGNFVGGLMGFLVEPFGIAAIYFIMMGVMILGALVTWFGVNEIDVPHEIPPFKLGEFMRGLIDPFKYSDFTWVLLTC